jgi:hypothetical protein
LRVVSARAVDDVKSPPQEEGAGLVTLVTDIRGISHRDLFMRVASLMHDGDFHRKPARGECSAIGDAGAVSGDR